MLERRVRLGDRVYYHTGPEEPNFPHGTMLAADVCMVCDEADHVNLQVMQPIGCGCFKKRDVPPADNDGPLVGCWSFRE